MEMKIYLDGKDAEMLIKHGITYSEDKEYSEGEAFDLLDNVRDAEVFFAQSNSAQALKNAAAYARIADKIQSQI